jgi:orotidine-5'-phosphate decarboxylase
MTTHQPFADRINTRIAAIDSLLCVGIDPVSSRLPSAYDGSSASIVRFCREIIEATADLAAAFKPNLGFFMALGPEGLQALAEVRAAIPRDVPVILDGKLNDMGETAKAYSHGVFDAFGFDALTVNPYLGEDAMAPYLTREDVGVIVLVKTSNPGSGDFQDLELASGEPLFLHVADRCRAWDATYPASVGMVVGATYPGQLAEVRKRCPEQIVLLPGVGAQGGDLEASVRAGMAANRDGLLCSASRAIMYAAGNGDVASSARTAAQELRDAINAVRTASS